MRRPTKRSLFLFLLVSIIVFFIGHRLFSSNPDLIDHCSSCLMYPILLIQSKVVVPLQKFVQRRQSIEELQTRFDNLQREHEQLQADYTALAASEHFVKETTELRSFKNRYDVSEKILTKILVKRLTDQEQVFLVDAGSYHGVRRDMVAVYKNNLIGRVTQVFPLYSKVTLTTDRTCKVSAQCHSSGTTGIYEGCNQVLCAALHHVSHLSSLQENDLVLSSGQGLVFPQGLALGRITSFRKMGLQYEVKLRPLVNMKEIQYCHLLRCLDRSKRNV